MHGRKRLIGAQGNHSRLRAAGRKPNHGLTARISGVGHYGSLMEEDADRRVGLWGWEWDFLAVDVVGQVAILSSAGYGAIPEPVLAAREAVERAIAAVASMPSATHAIQAEHGRDGDYSDWYTLSLRGFYTYDWHHYRGPYELISAPGEPLALSALPPSVRSAAAILTIPHAFADSAQLHL
jgi:hypothetical protein